VGHPCCSCPLRATEVRERLAGAFERVDFYVLPHHAAPSSVMGEAPGVAKYRIP
jgi:hypothetical protein